MSYNEAETRLHLIDPVLREKGYNDHQWLKFKTPAPVEPTGAKGRRRRGSGRTDYLLCVQVGEMPRPLPVAVLEAKKEDEDPLKGMQQAKGYANCQRFEINYVFASNGHRYGEFDLFSNLQSGPFPFADFPVHAELTARYAKALGIDLELPEDQEITANNLRYFGDPVYEYTLIEAQEDGYLAAKPTNIKTGKPITEADLNKELYTGRDFDNEIFIELRTPAMCQDLFKQLCEHGGPEQKVIIFCTREIHADRVAMQMNNLYTNWCKENGREPKDHYAFKRDIIHRVLNEAHTLDVFRALWIATQKRKQLIDHLLGENFSPELIREIDDMTDFDLFDFFGHHGYKARALKRPERGELFIAGNQDWFAGMERNAATVLKGFGRQFALGGTDALESSNLWNVPEIKKAGGLDALKTIGQPAQVLLDAKGRLFAA